MHISQREAPLSAAKSGRRGPREGKPQRPQGSAPQPINVRRRSHTMTTVDREYAAVMETTARVETMLSAPPIAQRSANLMTQAIPPRMVQPRTAVLKEGKATVEKKAMIKAAAIVGNWR